MAQGGVPLDDEQRELLSGRVNVDGLAATAKRIGVSLGTIRTALLGARLTAGVRTMIALGLETPPSLPPPAAGMMTHEQVVARATAEFAAQASSEEQRHVEIMAAVMNARTAANGAESAAQAARDAAARAERIANPMTAKIANHAATLAERAADAATKAAAELRAVMAKRAHAAEPTPVQAAPVTPIKHARGRARRSHRAGASTKSSGDSSDGEPPESDPIPPGRAA